MAPIPVPPPGGNLLVEIQDGTDDEVNQVVAENLAEGEGWLEGAEAEELGLLGEVFQDGETILDVLWRVNARENEIPCYPNLPNYYDPGYISDH